MASSLSDKAPAASGVEVGKLNDAALRRWLRGGVTRDFRDPQYPELRLRATADRKKASVFLVLNEGGKTVWQKQGVWPSMCIRTFVADLPVMLAKRSAGAEVLRGEFATVVDLLKWFLGHIEGNRSFSPSWRANCKSIVSKHLLGMFVDLPLAELTFVAVDSRLVKPMLAEGYSTNYIKCAVKVFKRAMSAAADLRLVEGNALAGYRVEMSLKMAPTVGTQLMESDLGPLFTALRDAIWPVAMLFMLMLMFGTRINETRLARWEHFAGDWWLIPASNAKNRQEHRLPLTPTAKALLTHYLQWQVKHVGKRAFLFPGDEGAISIRTAQYWSEQIRFKAFTSHALRKLCRTIIADMGVDTMVGERLLNHALPVLLRTYVHSTLDKGMLSALDAYHAHLILRGFNEVAPEIIPRSSVKSQNTQTQMASGWL
ncbi:tyrosine-type recombinase/integrase [Shewanella mangrovisoli]|uniref:tyrosine-type recombinase/integrase n=1 Tax=Shewanella mangrovisoli TaxID=2864211 RepID=UPI001C65CD2C|nr:tyrosine-type recombinase/integrase [Shewanella mangrovisoli]QYK07587.1 tyrosine-type recombinase/integrase [Shewanella mangrovisoli]